MKILRLELQGFKSFKDKTILSFDQDITAIVGSNGCGKSNVVDALYWVMGDMSPKHLRGNSMVDVIFSGSRSTAPMDMAEVSMILERDPEVDPALPPQFQSGNEVQITRRYYRHGESEYFINKVQCRLRDIQEFFMDTGVGAKSYSIIEQGAITRMVAQKPEERRLVIEDVAGIMKFKARRAETERKLENTRNNLQRIDDIVKDLQKQLQTLKRQADKAEKFQNFTEELKELEVRIAGREWKNRNNSTSENQEEIRLIQTQITQINQQLEEKKLELDHKKNSFHQLDEELIKRREERRSHELSLKDLESKVSTKETKLESVEQRKVKDQETLSEILSRRSVLDEEISIFDADIIELQSKAEEITQGIESIQHTFDQKKTSVEESRLSLDEQKKELHQEEIQQTKFTQEIQSIQKNIQQIEQRRENIETALESIASEVELHDSEKSSTHRLLEAAFSERKDLESAKEEIDREVLDLENKRNELQSVRDDLREKLTREKVRKEHLESLEKDLEGVESATRRIAIEMREQGGRAHLLAEEVSVPEILEKAVEAVLGRNLQRVLTDDLDSAESIFSTLNQSEDQEARKGRASFFLSSIAQKYQEHISTSDLSTLPMPGLSEESSSNGQAQPHSEEPGPDGLVGSFRKKLFSFNQEKKEAPRTVKDYLVQHPDVVGCLADLVREKLPEDKNHSWTFLLEGVWVTKSRSSFKEIIDTVKSLPLCLVSLDGDILRPDGRIEFAPLEEELGELTQGLVQRRREISNLQVTVQQSEEELSQVQQQLTKIAESLGDCRERSRALTSKLVSLNPDMEKHSQFLRQVEAQIARLVEKKSILSQEREEKETQREDLSLSLEEKTELLSGSEERRLQAHRKVDEAQSELSQRIDSLKEFESQLEEQRKELSIQNTLLSEKQKNLAASKQEIHLSGVREEQINKELLEIDSQMEQLKTEIDNFSAENETEKEKLISLIASEEEQLSKVEEERKYLDSLQKEIDNFNKELHGKSESVSSLEQKLAVNEVEIRTLQDQIFAQYQINFNELGEDTLKELLSPGDLEEGITPEVSREKAAQLRAKIDRLGKINMVAMEEFHDLSKRHEYLFIQRQDVWDAIAQLEEAIERFDKESRERFEESFNAVNEAFQKTFPILFGGGQAELRLTDPENMLESGVEIVAQPPGKKLQSVTLLSGGEKALTAVSLIFGIFSIKPSPFAVLDEVDAPLDDTNVGRFNSQVREMALKSQIIMITHHKKTMESSDALYGVTMEQPGISKIASARLGDIRVK